MGIFGSKKSSYLGVDLGAGGLKLTEIKNEKGRASLMTYGFTERMPGALPISPVDAPQETAELIRSICKKAKTTTVRAVTSLPVASVFSSVISIPRGSDKDFREAIRWQAKKLIPVPLDEMTLDFKVIGAVGDAVKTKPTSKTDKTQPKNVPVLITGAANSMVQKYISVFRAAGLTLVSLETEAFAMIRSLVGKDRSAIMIVDIGAVRTNIIIVENGVPYVARSLDMGGVNFSKTIAQTLTLGLEDAEKMKCDTRGIRGLYPDSGLPKVFASIVSPLVTEIQYSLNLYGSREREADQPERRVEKIILTGGGAALPALADFLGQQVGIKAYVGDPWARVMYPEGLRPILDDIGYRFAVSVGLAMRDIE